MAEGPDPPQGRLRQAVSSLRSRVVMNVLRGVAGSSTSRITGLRGATRGFGQSGQREQSSLRVCLRASSPANSASSSGSIAQPIGWRVGDLAHPVTLRVLHSRGFGARAGEPANPINGRDLWSCRAGRMGAERTSGRWRARLRNDQKCPSSGHFSLWTGSE